MKSHTTNVSFKSGKQNGFFDTEILFFSDEACFTLNVSSQNNRY
jgi:hypothetical protein